MGGEVIEHQGGSTALSAVQVRGQVQRIQEIMREVMKEDVHYGIIPGTPKRSLYKAGAEKLCMTFHFGPDYDIVDKERDGDHLTIISKCTLVHIPTGQKVGSALGSCSTMEAKYAYRKGVRKCPQCDEPAIIKGKAEYGGGWLCFKNKGGCGAKFSDGDPAIESQETGRIENDDKADQFNTVLKMSNKRALLAAVLNATAASDIFAQDLMDDDGTVTAAGQDAQKQTSAPKKTAVKEPQRKSAAATGTVNATHLAVINRTLDARGDDKMDALNALLADFEVDALEKIPAAKVNDAIDFARDWKAA